MRILVIEDGYPTSFAAANYAGQDEARYAQSQSEDLKI